ncbi:phage tail tape measure protein [Photobacterium damselae]|uniref:phage tail tape measure protein n=1 Tax=Photobacterium damselae TaxID=38293 RepID=UPI001EFD2987|nr:phage tail tape measure protein [Photobacterium damselae]MCG9778734.1 phage tail tape measure protein [Photobacterium damselae]
MSLPAPLMFQVGLIDKISKPLGNIQRQFSALGNEYRDGTHTMIAGAAGVAGAGFAMQSALMPAIELDRALKDVKALGVADAALDKVAKTAMMFSAQYGVAAVEVIQHTEQITNGMGKMEANVLASVTRSSATLAMAMKSDAETVGRYMKNLYGNYQKQADSMGKDVWAAQVAGMTAEVKRLYGTNMDQLEGMVDGMHSLTSSLGVGLPEQLAVLGFLNTQMSEGDAVTQYTNYLEGAIDAQKKLGVSLVDSKGNMLPMLDVLKKIKPLLKGMKGADATHFLNSAGLGDGSLMLMKMLEKTDELSNGINQLGNVKGLNAASKMAATMTDQWKRMEQGLNSIRIAFGYAVMPAVLDVVSVMSDWAQEIVKLTQFLPNITRLIGKLVLSFFALAAVGGAVTLAMGMWKQVTVTLKIMTMALTKSYSFLRGALIAARVQISLLGLQAKLTAAAQWILNTAVTASKFAYNGAITSLKWMARTLVSASFAALKFTASLLTNPIFLMVAGITAAVVAIGALIYYWDDLKASFGDTVWFQAIMGGIQAVTFRFQLFFQMIKGGWQWVMSGFTDTSGFDGLFALVDSLRNAFGSAFSWIMEQMEMLWEKAKGLISWIPGMGGDDETGKSQSLQQATPRLAIQPGGAAKSLASYTNTSYYYDVGGIHTQNMSNKQDFVTEIEMAAG